MGECLLKVNNKVIEATSVNFVLVFVLLTWNRYLPTVFAQPCS